MRFRIRQAAFTLIEVLVVVAIIALLVAILLPSLARARAQAKMIMCQTGMRQVTAGFVTYTVESKGRLPGQRGDDYADWLGGSNRNKLTGNKPGRQPDDGTIWKYMGRDKWVYVCPDDLRPNLAKGTWYYSYTSNLLVSGAKPEMLAGGHYPVNDFSNKNHVASATRPLRPFEGTPVLIEEDKDYWLANVDDSGWCNDDRITDRHLQTGGKGWGNLGFVDGHVGRIQLTPKGANVNKYFAAVNMCLRTKGGKWVSGYAWSKRGGMFAYMDEAEPASTYGITH